MRARGQHVASLDEEAGRGGAASRRGGAAPSTWNSAPFSLGEVLALHVVEVVDSALDLRRGGAQLEAELARLEALPQVRQGLHPHVLQRVLEALRGGGADVQRGRS